MRSPRLIIAALATSLVLAACQSTGPASPAPSAATTGATPGVTATPAPSPTAPPPNVAALFSVQAKKLTNATYDFTGTVTVGLVQSTITGTSTVNGPDSLQAATTTLSGVDTTVDAAQTAGKRYVEGSGLPWLEAPGTATAHNLGAELERAAGAAFTDTGVEARDGRQVHKLTAGAAGPFDPIALVPNSAAATNPMATVVFFATDDGAPVGATIDATWSQGSGDKAVDGSLSVDVRIRQLGIILPVQVPDHVWTVFKSSRWHYSMAYPDDYGRSQDKYGDYFDGPSFDYVYADRIAAQGFTLNTIAKGEVTYLKSVLAARSTRNEPITIGGASGRLLTVSGYDKPLKSKVVNYEVVVVKGAYVYFVGWISKPGNEAADLVTFKLFVATFKFT